jgi:16S rRNA processing protein RimM
VVGRLGRPHGLDGFLGLYIEDEDANTVQPGSAVYLGDSPHRVRALRRVDRGYQVAFEGIDDRSAAEEVRGLDVTVESRRDLEEKEFWPGDLIGLAVHDQAGNQLGVVVDVLFGAGQERLVVEMAGGSTFEVPFVDDLVPLVDLAGHRIQIVPIPGLTEPSD